VRVELAAEKPKIADSLLSKAMQECPTAGELWALAIELAPRAQQKSRSVDALKRCDNDARVVLAVARIFWSERRVDKARTWLNRAVHLDASNGDAWATLYKFEAQHGDAASLDAIVQRCVEAEPHYGEAWIGVSKLPANFALTTDAILKRVALTV
jgi:pre-mRNA-processing factor 6